jgi:hypothetical protein
VYRRPWWFKSDDRIISIANVDKTLSVVSTSWYEKVIRDPKPLADAWIASLMTLNPVYHWYRWTSATKRAAINKKTGGSRLP